jgi:hypothetical protein
MTTSGLSLDAGALIAIDRGSRPVLLLVLETLDAGGEVHITAGALAQVWRGGATQARLARVLNSDGVGLPALDTETARAVGELCGRSRHADIVDVHVVLHAREHGHRVLTADPDDLRKVDPGLPLIVV